MSRLFFSAGPSGNTFAEIEEYCFKHTAMREALITTPTDNLAVRIRKVGHVGSRTYDGAAKAAVDVASPSTNAGRGQAEIQY